MTDDAAALPTPHQRVGWLELFYDLVFVVVIEKLTHLLHDDPHAGRIWLTIGLTGLVWLAWFNVSALTNVSGEVGPRGRPLVFASMAGTGVLALGVEGMPEGHVWLFVLGYTIARTAISPLWMRSQGRAGRAWARPLFFGPVLGVLWLTTVFLPAGAPLVIAFVVLALAEMALSIAHQQEGGAARIHGPHMVERIGLLLMIVLGECVVQIVESLDGPRGPMTWVTAAVAMALLCALWWLIYEATMTKLEEAVERDDASIFDFIGFPQLGIIAGLVLLAAGVADAVHAAQASHGGHLHHGSLTCLCVGMLMIHIGTRSLTRRAFATNLGLPRRVKGQTREERRAERERMRAEQEEARRRREHEARSTGVRGGAKRLASAVMALLQGVTYLVPVILVWVLGAHWAPWIVVSAMFVYVAVTIWSQGLGERRITAYIASGGYVPGGATAVSSTSMPPAHAGDQEPAVADEA